MGIVNNLKRAVDALRGRESAAFAAQSPRWETEIPQYPSPNPYNLAVAGYTRNELVYACIQKRAVAVSEPPFTVYGKKDDSSSRIDNHPLRQLIAQPNEQMGEVEFWQAVEIYTCIAGFSAWEIERTNGGDPIALWPMRPDWCSFKRGPARPLAYVRYAPPGLPAQDVPIEDVLLFSEFSPLSPMLRGMSKTAVALRVVQADNSATDFVTSFFQRGASVAGVLTTTASLSDAEARRIRERWREAHGGVENWGDIAVLGSGAKFESAQMSFRDMDFTGIDARDEARICAVFNVPPILVGAKVGLSASTYSNYEQARKAFYEETIFPRWRWFESELREQLVKPYSKAGNVYAAFDTSKVRALREGKESAWLRAMQAARSNLITRDEARAEMGYDAIDHAPVFVGEAPSEETVANEPPPAEDQDNRRLEVRLKSLRRDCIAAIKAGAAMPDIPDMPDLSAALRACKTAGDVRRAFEEHWPREDGIGTLAREIRRARVALEMAYA